MANLVENAVKFTPAGGRIQLGAELVDDRCVKIAVSDTGCGIAEEHLPKIFDKFYRAPSGSDPAPGAGLGLAIAKGLVELHGGTLIVESAPGKGSLFSFTLPSVQANERSRAGTGCPD
jgi:histidine kinase